MPPRVHRLDALSCCFIPGWAARLLLGLLLFTLPAAVQAQFSYTTNNGTLTITKYTGPGGVVSIPGTIDGLPVEVVGAFSFFGTTNLTSVALPNSVTTIEEVAFRGCTGLTSVTIPNSVTTIGYYAFRDCTGLTSVTIGNSVTTLGSAVFSGCTGLTNVTIPNSVTTIGPDWFSGCTGLTSIVLPNRVTAIWSRAFYGCTGLTNVTIPNSVTTLGYGAFSDCTGLTSVDLPISIIIVGDTSFYGCSGLTSVTIRNGVTTIGDNAFSECAGLKAIEVEALNPAYSSWDGVLFNKNQTELLQCPGGKAGSFTIPDSVTNIEQDAFYGCANLTSVTIPKSVTTIEEYAFSECAGLKAIEVEALNPAYSSLDGVLFNKDRTTLLQCPGGKAGNYTLPNSVTTIRDEAFFGSANLTSVTIPNSVSTIEGGAFRYCTGLKAIEVEALNPAYSSWGGVLFNKNRTTLLRCPSGRTGNYTVPNSVTTIGDNAFSDCTGLTRVTIANNVTTIDSEAFTYCPSLTGVYFQGNAPWYNSNDEWEDTFEGSDGLTVYFLAGTSGWGATYADRSTAVWSRPLILSDGPGFGVGACGFGFTISWAPNASVVVEASPAGATPVWTPVSTNLLTTGAAQFNDPQWTDHSDRLYRLTTP